MCIYLYIYIYIYIYIVSCASMCSVCIHVCIYTHILIVSDPRVYACIHPNVCMCICVRIFIHVCILIFGVEFCLLLVVCFVSVSAFCLVLFSFICLVFCRFWVVSIDLVFSLVLLNNKDVKFRPSHCHSHILGHWICYYVQADAHDQTIFIHQKKIHQIKHHYPAYLSGPDRHRNPHPIASLTLCVVALFLNL